MKPPKCRVCGKEHWNTEPHDMGEAGTQAGHRKKVTADNDQLPVVPTKFDRTAYQREYMRKRRAKR